MELRHLLADFTVDSERTLFAGEPFLVTVINGEERETVQKKLIELVKRV